MRAFAAAIGLYRRAGIWRAALCVDHRVRANWRNGGDRLAKSVEREGEAGFLREFASAQHHTHAAPRSPRQGG